MRVRLPIPSKYLLPLVAAIAGVPTFTAQAIRLHVDLTDAPRNVYHADLHVPVPAVDDDWAALNASMEKMHATMALVKPSGDRDADFVRLMLPHHQAAVEMAKTELLYGRDPQMRRLAQEIVTDQQSETELMRLWLKQHPPQK